MRSSMKDMPTPNECTVRQVIMPGDDPYHFEDDPSSCGCSPFVPAGSRGFFFKFAMICLVVGGGLMYGIFRVCEFFA